MANEPELDRDDLAAITDIDPEARRLLKTQLNIHTFDDLANISPGKIASALKNNGRTDVTRDRIKRWIAIAKQSSEERVLYEPGMEPTSERALASLSQTRGTHDAPASKGSSQPEHTSAPAGTSEIVKDNGWQPFATFVVEFQERTDGVAGVYRTSVHYMQADKGSAWDGIEQGQSCEWMFSQIADQIVDVREQPTAQVIHHEIAETPALRTSEPIPVPQPSAPTRPDLVFDQLRIYQPPHQRVPVGIGTARQPISGIVQSAFPFTVEIILRTVGVISRRLTGHHIEIYAHNLDKGRSSLLGRDPQIALTNGQPYYTLRLADVRLEAYTYRLQVVVNLIYEDVSVSGYLEMPAFTLV